MDNNEWVADCRLSINQALAAMYPEATDLEVSVACEAMLDLVVDATAYLTNRLNADWMSGPEQEQVLEIALGAYRLDPERVDRLIGSVLPADSPAREVQRVQMELESALGAPVEAWDGSEVAPEAWEKFRRYLSLLEGEEVGDPSLRLDRLAAEAPNFSHRHDN